jgi:hypothetical protein
MTTAMYISIALIVLSFIPLIFGLWIYNKVAPLFYFALGLVVGASVSNYALGAFNSRNEIIELSVAIATGIVFAVLGWKVEPARRYGLGAVLGMSIGVAVSAVVFLFTAFNIFIAAGIVAVLGLIGAFAYSRIGDYLLIAGTAFAAGAAIVDNFARIFPSETFLQRNTIFERREWIPVVIWLALAVVGIAIQVRFFKGLGSAKKAATAEGETPQVAGLPGMKEIKLPDFPDMSLPPVEASRQAPAPAKAKAEPAPAPKVAAPAPAPKAAKSTSANSSIKADKGGKIEIDYGAFADDEPEK